MIIKIGKIIDINQDLIALTQAEIETYIISLYGLPLNKRLMLEEDFSLVSVIFEYGDIDINLIEGYFNWIEK